MIIAQEDICIYRHEQTGDFPLFAVFFVHEAKPMPQREIMLAVVSFKWLE